MNTLNQKYNSLKTMLSELESLVVAFSGGVDSTFLLNTAHDVLGNNVFAVTARSLSFPKRELDESITPDRLSKIDRAEQFLLDLGFRQVRVRYHGNLARIETDEQAFSCRLDGNIRKQIDEKFREIGFTYIAVDIRGYRTGSMNETLPGNEHAGGLR